MEKRTQESESLGYNEIYWYINTYFCKNLLFWKVMFFLKDLCAESADSQFDAAWICLDIITCLNVAKLQGPLTA